MRPALTSDDNVLHLTPDFWLPHLDFAFQECPSGTLVSSIVHWGFLWECPQGFLWECHWGFLWECLRGCHWGFLWECPQGVPLGVPLGCHWGCPGNVQGNVQGNVHGRTPGNVQGLALCLVPGLVLRLSHVLRLALPHVLRQSFGESLGKFGKVWACWQSLVFRGWWKVWQSFLGSPLEFESLAKFSPSVLSNPLRSPPGDSPTTGAVCSHRRRMALYALLCKVFPPWVSTFAQDKPSDVCVVTIEGVLFGSSDPSLWCSMSTSERVL